MHQDIAHIKDIVLLNVRESGPLWFTKRDEHASRGAYLADITGRFEKVEW